jgi:hypothetical protein
MGQVILNGLAMQKFFNKLFSGENNQVRSVISSAGHSGYLMNKSTYFLFLKKKVLSTRNNGYSQTL